MNKGNNLLPNYDCKHIFVFQKKIIQASFMTCCPLIHLFLSRVLTHSIHNYYKCYHFFYFTYMTLFLACSTPVIDINDRVTRFSFNQNLNLLIKYIIKHDIQIHVFEKESSMKCIHVIGVQQNHQSHISFSATTAFYRTKPILKDKHIYQ